MAREIAAAGADIVQFDEPAFNVFFDKVRDLGGRAPEAHAARPPARATFATGAEPSAVRPFSGSRAYGKIGAGLGCVTPPDGAASWFSLPG